MSLNIKFLYIALSMVFFIVLPSIFFIFSEVPQRTILKDTLSIITILSFFVVLGQFYLSRINESLKGIFNAAKIIKIHKLIGYIVLPILILHPFLIIVPRFFEVGPNPLDSFITMITTVDSLQVILGIIAWVLMLLLGLTSLYKDKLKMSYKSWKILHGVLSLTFIILASWHAIDIGRHMSFSMSLLMIGVVSIASVLLLKSYFIKSKKASTQLTAQQKEKGNE